MMTKSGILRELFKKKNIIYIVGAHDGLSAKLVECNGFDGVWASSFEVSTSFAVPDANILTMSQYLERASEMNDAVSIPVVADCDTGYGNSNNVIHMVKKYEAAGIAAVCIEDKKFPKVNSLLAEGRQELAPIAEFVGKITAAKNAQASEDFMVIARIEALIAGLGEQEALLRAEKYAEAGADAILIHSKSKTYDEIVNFAKKWERLAPLVIVPTTYSSIMADFSQKEVSGLGIKMVIFANHGLRASIKAVTEVLEEIKKVGGIHTAEKKIATMEEVFELQGIIDMKEQEKKYLKSEHEDVVVIIPAAGKPRHQESIEPLLRDRPLCTIDINGKTLLERNADTLEKFRIKNTNIIIGYKKEQVLKELNVLDNINLIVNTEFETKHVLHSIMLAQDEMTDRTLMIYSDILFDESIIDKILQVREDIVLAGDNTYKKYGKRNKKLDLIEVSESLVTGRREIINELLPVERVGQELDGGAADFEFTGIAYFSRRGIKTFKDMYQKNRKSLEGTNKKFHEAINFNQASLTDMLQEAIDNGMSVKLLPVNAGWMEIHEFEDYKLACKKIKGKK